MSNRTRRRLALAAVLAALAVPGAAIAACKQVSGPFTSVLVPPPTCTSGTGLCTLGTLTGDLRASYFFSINTLAPSGNPNNPAELAYTGTSVITITHGGAQLFSNDTGVMDASNPFAVPFVTTVNIYDGTKQYAGATGQLVASGTLSFVTGNAVGSYTGSICKAGDDDE